MSDSPQLSDLLKHRAFLERFARRLAQDDSVADDVVQETWLVALERPPRHRENLRAWLRRVARNVFLRRQRPPSVASAVEDVAADGTESPDAALEQKSIARLLGAELLALPEPYRAVLIQRYYEDKVPSVIAHELGRSVNTVNSQLARGLKLMQERLDRASPGGRSQWVRGLLFLAPTSARDGASSGRDAEPVARVPRARTKALLGVAVVALVASGLVIRALVKTPDASDRTAAAQERTTLDSSSSGEWIGVRPSDATGERVPTPAEPSPTPAEPVLAPAAPDPGPSVLVEVVAADGRPIPGALVQTTRSSSPSGSSQPMTTFDGQDFTDENGRVEIPLTDEHRGRLSISDAEHLGVVAHASGFMSSDFHGMPFPESGRTSVTIRLEPSEAAVRGKVTDPDGAPVEGAFVEIGQASRKRTELGGGRFLRKEPMTKKSRADGSFAHAGLPTGRLVVVVECPGFLLHTGSIDVSDSSSVYDVVLRRGATVAGRVTTADGLAAAGARLCVEQHPKGAVPAFQRAIADEDGRFELTGIVPGEAWLVAEHATVAGQAASERVTLVDGRTTWNPRLQDMPPLRLRVQHVNGTPLVGALVAVYTTQVGEAWLRSREVGADGRVRFEAVPATDLTATVFLTPGDRDQGLPPCLALTGLRGGPDEHALVLTRENTDRGSVVGVLLDHAGKPLPEARLQLRPPYGSTFYPTPVSAETGAFRNDRLPTQSYEATAWCASLGTVPLGQIEVFARDTYDLGEIRLPRLVPWSAAWPSPAAPAGDAYELVKVDPLEGLEVRKKLWMVASGSGPPPPSFALFPGRYEWLVYAEGKLLLREDLDLR